MTEIINKTPTGLCEMFFSKRVEFRLCEDELDTLDKIAKNRNISRSGCIRALIEKERKACDQNETNIAVLKKEIIELNAVIVCMRETKDRRQGDTDE
jgi:hypothetical protein